MDLSESPEAARDSKVAGDLNLSYSSWTQDREDDCRERESPPTATKTATAPAATVPRPAASGETSLTVEEVVQKGVELDFQPPLDVSCVLFVLPATEKFETPMEKTTFLPLWDRMEGAWLSTLDNILNCIGNSNEDSSSDAHRKNSKTSGCSYLVLKVYILSKYLKQFYLVTRLFNLKVRPENIFQLIYL